MDFKFTDGDAVLKEVWSCTECIYVSTKKHFHIENGEPLCPLCSSEAEHRRTVEQQTGMRDVEYAQLLEWLEQESTGVGPTVTDRIREQYPNGDDFIEVTKKCYETNTFGDLTKIAGIGKETAHKKIVLPISRREDWSGGKAELLIL